MALERLEGFAHVIDSKAISKETLPGSCHAPVSCVTGESGQDEVIRGTSTTICSWGLIFVNRSKSSSECTCVRKCELKVGASAATLGLCA